MSCAHSRVRHTCPLASFRSASVIVGLVIATSGCSGVVVAARNDVGVVGDVGTDEQDVMMGRLDADAPVRDAVVILVDVPRSDSNGTPDVYNPPVPYPRPIAPLSLGDVSLLRPTLRWELPAGTDGAEVQLCRDRACTMVIETLRTLGSSARPTMALPPRSVVFWRLRATMGMSTAMMVSPTWLFHVPATDNSGGIDTSANPHLDVNGDGFDDVVVGAPAASPGGRVNVGAASVFYGSLNGIPMVAAQVLEGTDATHGFGHTVASAGDVNGDGFGDLVVGTEQAETMGRPPTPGTVSVFHGGEMGVTAAPARVLQGVVPGELFGFSVAGAGDLNADGFADVVVGSYRAAPGGSSDAGTVSVYYGGAMGIPMVATRVIAGQGRGARFGYSVASAGDVNGDGFSDLVVGAIPGAGAGTVRGAAHVFHGSISGVAWVADRIVERASSQFGTSVASAGDVNGDGFGDLVVGAAEDSSPDGAQGGTVSVFHGSMSGIAMVAARVLNGGPSPFVYFGGSVASAGDVNGDGFGDLVVGATGAGPRGNEQAGTASVFQGSATGIPLAAARVLVGVRAGDLFGCSVASAGDVNGDGFADLVVGARVATPNQFPRAGSASVFHGSAMGVAMIPALVLEGGPSGSFFGQSVASIGELRTRGLQRWFASVAATILVPSGREQTQYTYQLRPSLL